MTTLANATTNSDNSVYAELGLKLGPRKVAAMARRLGIRTPVSRNAANALGGLKQGVTPLDMAHAYETFAQRGELTYGSLSPGDPDDRKVTPIPGPVGHRGDRPRRARTTSSRSRSAAASSQNRTRTRRVLDPGRRRPGRLDPADRREVRHRHARVRARRDRRGKTGTTEGYGDAWFVGWTKEYTVAIWVGYPDQFKPMETEFQGDPVAGGTYPAGIFKTFIEALVGMKKVKKDTTDVAPAVPPGTSTGGVVRRPDGARHGRARSRAAARRRRRRPVPQQAPAQPEPPQAQAPADPTPAPEQPPEQPAEPPPDTGGAAAAPAPASRAASFGRGRETLREPGTQKRQGSSAALVIPIRVPTTGSTSSQPGGAGSIAIGPPLEVGAVEVEVDPERLRELARARAEVLDALQAAPLAHRGRCPRAAPARGSAPPRRRPRARRRRSAARGCRRSGRRRRGRAARTGCACAA